MTESKNAVIYAYSTDEENFTGEFNSPEEAAADCFHNFSDVDTVFVGIKHTLTAHDFIDPVYLLEKISDEAYNECGSAALEWLDKIQESKAKREELKKLIGDWLEANAPVTFFKVDDVIEYAREDYGLDDDDDDGAGYV
jgi:hypothetical protein